MSRNYISPHKLHFIRTGIQHCLLLSQENVDVNIKRTA